MKEQGWRKVTYGTFPRPGRTVYAHCGMECSSNFRQCPKTEESDIKLAAAVNLSGVDFCLLKTAAQFGINQQRKKCHVKTACLKMLKLRQQKKKFIHTTTMVLHLSCSVIPLSSCVLHGSEVHAVILSMHTNASSVVIEGLVFSPPRESVCLGVCQHRGRCRFRSKSPRQSLRWVGGLSLFAIDTPIDGLSWECTLPANWHNSFDVQRSTGKNSNISLAAIVSCRMKNLICLAFVSCRLIVWWVYVFRDGSPPPPPHGALMQKCIYFVYYLISQPLMWDRLRLNVVLIYWALVHIPKKRNQRCAAMARCPKYDRLKHRGIFPARFWPIANLLASQSEQTCSVQSAL